jgi:ATP-binding cassette subfamily F protein 3
LEALNINNTMLEELKQAGSEKTEAELRTILGCFLFSNDDVFKKIKVLSGGEKSRVALAKTLISEANFLLLDEPTNHLDMQSVNILSQALQQYEGTYLVISHDRHFVSRVANKIWYIEDYQIKQYPGTYDEYEWWRAEKAEKEKEEAAKPGNAPKKQAPAKPVYSDTEKQGFGRNLKKAAQRAEELEKQITELEKRKAALETRLAQPDTYGDAKKLQQANAEYKQVEGLLNTAQEDWETAMLEVEELEKKMA